MRSARGWVRTWVGAWAGTWVGTWVGTWAEAWAGTWLRLLWPHLLTGAVCTLVLAWVLPLFLAMRGLAPAVTGEFMQRLVAAPETDAASVGSAAAAGHARWPASVEVRRGAFGDWCVAQPASEGPDGPPARGRAWPDGALFEANAERHAPPFGCVVAPREADRDRYARIDTELAGWPFRAFAGEAWYRASPGGWFEPVPEIRWSWHLGMVEGQPALVALRPLPLGLALDILFWSAASWTLVAAPRAFRRRRRERAGRCGSCAYPRAGGASTAQPASRSAPSSATERSTDPTTDLPTNPAANSSAIPTTTPTTTPTTDPPTRLGTPTGVGRTACPECGAPAANDPLGFASNPEMLHQNAYVWFVFVSSLDIMLTWKILDRGGVEVNPVAELVIGHWGMHGAIAFKFALMMFVIVTCEISGRLRPRTGRALSVAAVAVSAMPVAWSLFLLAVHEFVP